MRRPASIDLPWVGGEWVRVSPDQPPRPELVDLSGDTLPLTSRQRKARASVAILCPTEAPAEHVEDEPAALSSETDAQRRARQAKAATAGWT